MVPSSARRIAPNSSGYMSRDASRIIRRVFREIATTRFMMLSLSRQLFLDTTIEIVPEPDELRSAFRPGQDDILAAFQARLMLSVHHEKTLLRFHETDMDMARSREHVRPRR